MTVTSLATDRGLLTIRPATLADLDAIHALHDAVYHETQERFGEVVLSTSGEIASPLQHSIRVQANGHRTDQVLVAETEQGTLVGYVLARHRRPSFSWIDQEVVARDFRACGIGQAFTERVVAHAADLHKRFVGLSVSEAGNVQFHERQGFVVTSTRPPNAQHRFSTLVMQRRLDGIHPDGLSK